jgi:hypothetical protein
MEAKLFSHSERGGFSSKEELRSWLDKGLREDGIYLFARVFDVPANSLAFFEMEGTIIGCAVVSEAAHEMKEADKYDYGEDTGEEWKAIIKIDTKTIWVWRPEQDVRLKEAGIEQFLPGPPMPLAGGNVLKIFQLVARRS